MPCTHTALHWKHTAHTHARCMHETKSPTEKIWRRRLGKGFGAADGEKCLTHLFLQRDWRRFMAKIFFSSNRTNVLSRTNRATHIRIKSGRPQCDARSMLIASERLDDCLVMIARWQSLLDDCSLIYNGCWSLVDDRSLNIARSWLLVVECLRLRKSNKTDAALPVSPLPALDALFLSPTRSHCPSPSVNQQIPPVFYRLWFPPTPSGAAALLT